METFKPPPPPLRPIVHLLARKWPTSYERVQEALWARGWVVAHDHMSAWHLVRAGTPAVKVEVVDGTMGPHFGYDWAVQIGQVRARHVDGEHELLWATMDTLEAPLIPAEEDGKKTLDGAVIARWVAEHMPTAAR